MAKIVNTWVEESGEMVEYESGMIRNKTTGRIVIPPVTTRITTPERSSELRQAYKDKTRDKLRETISEIVFGQGKMAPEAFAYVGGELFRSIAMNEEANPRDRLQTYVAIGKHSDLLGDLRENVVEQDGVKISLGADVARELVARIMERRNEQR